MSARSILESGRIAGEANTESGGGFCNTGKTNAYVCDAGAGYSGMQLKQGCGCFIITIDRHAGVTPFGIRCGNCDQFAYSKMYKVSSDLIPSHEWYRPDTLEGIDKRQYEHLEKGGLILRAIPGQPDEWSKPIMLASLASEFAELKRQSDDAYDRVKTTPIMTRQQMRREERKKGRDAPETIEMYGHTYLRVD